MSRFAELGEVAGQRHRGAGRGGDGLGGGHRASAVGAAHAVARGARSGEAGATTGSESRAGAARRHRLRRRPRWRPGAGAAGRCGGLRRRARRAPARPVAGVVERASSLPASETSVAALRNSRTLLPSDEATSGSLPGPSTTSAMIRIRISSPGPMLETALIGPQARPRRPSGGRYGSTGSFADQVRAASARRSPRSAAPRPAPSPTAAPRDPPRDVDDEAAARPAAGRARAVAGPAASTGSIAPPCAPTPGTRNARPGRDGAGGAELLGRRRADDQPGRPARTPARRRSRATRAQSGSSGAANAPSRVPGGRDPEALEVGRAGVRRAAQDVGEPVRALEVRRERLLAEVRVDRDRVEAEARRSTRRTGARTSCRCRRACRRRSPGRRRGSVPAAAPAPARPAEPNAS